MPSPLSSRLTRLPRRSVVGAGALSLLGLSLPEMLSGRALAAASTTGSFGKAKGCILLFMWGGPAHQDTWDMKPDAPVEYRGEFRPIATRVPGIRICEHLPRLAGHTDKLAILRSMTHPDVDHTTATHYLLTGRGVPRRGGPRAEDWPGYGAVLDWLGRGRGPLPPSVSVMPIVPNGAPRFVEESHGQDGGWLGPLHHPMRIDNDPSRSDYHVGEFGRPTDVPADRAAARRLLLRDLERSQRAQERRTEVAAMQGHYQ